MSKTFTDVQMFMLASGQTVNTNNEEQSQLYHRLINEEYNEFIIARNQKDDVETLDACFDMMWVIIGYMLSKGYDVEGAWDEGAKSNLAKIDTLTGKVTKREDGKVLKPEGWKKPDFSKYTLKEACKEQKNLI
jgi:predicted HAD superfamily Cof-like phosphohydrolase